MSTPRNLKTTRGAEHLRSAEYVKHCPAERPGCLDPREARLVSAGRIPQGGNGNGSGGGGTSGLDVFIRLFLSLWETWLGASAL